MNEEGDSGPFCRHWSSAEYCDEPCATCGHACHAHAGGGSCFGSDECTCVQFKDAEDLP